MEEKQNQTNLKVTTNEKKEPSFLKDMQGDINDMMVESAMSDPNIKPMLDKVRIAFKPLVGMAVQKLGDDDIRYMVWRDPSSKCLVLETMHMSNIELSYKKDPTKDDLFILPEDTENVDDLIKEIFKKLIPKMF